MAKPCKGLDLNLLLLGIYNSKLLTDDNHTHFYNLESVTLFSQMNYTPGNYDNL